MQRIPYAGCVWQGTEGTVHLDRSSHPERLRHLMSKIRVQCVRYQRPGPRSL